MSISLTDWGSQHLRHPLTPRQQASPLSEWRPRYVYNQRDLNSCLFKSQVYLREYFDNFPDFHYNPSRGTMAQFYRLARREGWSKDEFREQKEAIQTALVLQFNEIYGESENELQNWQQLCEAMDIEPMPKSVKQCKKVRKSSEHRNVISEMCSSISDV